MIGRTIYRLNQKFGHGLYTAWRRDVTRWSILRTDPVVGLTDDRCEIHVLTCERDWLDLIWALKSFFATANLKFRLCIHEDGSLREESAVLLRSHFPDAQLVLRRDANERLNDEGLRKYPRCASLRAANVLALKVFDFKTYLRSDRLMLVDSDVLFFRRPEILLERILDTKYRYNSLNRDWGMGYSVDPHATQALVPFRIQSHINAGLGLMHRHSYDFELFEWSLGLPGILSHPHRIEQTLVALACSRFGHEFLPSEYDVTLDKAGPTQIVKHYTGPIRHLLYREGIDRVRPLLAEAVSKSRTVGVGAMGAGREITLTSSKQRGTR